MGTIFSDILRSAVEATPGALGGAFAAADGETVDSFSRLDVDDWAILTAHYGVVLAHVQAALHTFHYGEAELILVSHERADILVSAVREGYYALLAIERPSPLAAAMRQLRRAAAALRQEMV
jgi:predicted regulator of Ras-like GTPase activity (Roadblock/LC7/MglB family)